MAELRVHKVVSALPSTLEPDSLYLVRTAAGFDLYATNHSGTVISYPANYQAKHQNLSALAGLTGAANKMFYFTSASEMALADLTVFGRQLVASADAPAARTALGLGTAAVRNVGTGGFDLVENQALGTAARKNVTTSATDVTPDRVLRTGDGGWMGDVPVGVNDIDDRTLRGWRYVVEASGGTKPINTVYGQLLTLGNTNDSVFQEYWELSGSSRTHRRFYRQCFGSGPWGDWQPVMSTAERQRFPFPNILPDGGRFAGKVDLTSLTVSNSFTVGNFFPAYNGATITSGGKFIHSNTADGQMTEPVTSLLTAMLRLGDDRRYGVEFFVATVTAGSSTTVPAVGSDGVTRYLLMAMQRAIASAANYATFVTWVRVRSGSAHMISECYIDGVFYPAGKVLPSGWRHLRIVAPSGYGYFSQMPNIYSLPGSILDFALPGYFSGEVDVGRHVIPLLGFNGVAS